MKLLRLGERGRERPAVLISDDEAIDVSSIVGDFDPSFFAGGGIDRIRRALDDANHLPRVQIGPERVGAPIVRPGKLMAVGLNYRDHAEETRAPIPDRPIIFDKAVSSINGPYDDVVIPSNYRTVDHEVELAIVFGKTARRVRRSDALGYVAGYLICNDISERTAQAKEGGQWYRGKSFDTFAPLGPYLVTADEVPDPHRLHLTCTVDSELRQSGCTEELIFDIGYLIEFVSRNVTIEPGDVMTTGTPAGVGMGRTPPLYLAAGQMMELEITGLGKQCSRLIAE
jgi:2-keto-4-pentenoate hydratase/2-oxohepta-3-ene-1,7-dioic acid hydratase in catechol pathway